jgi:uncharacterized Ntn-hydrolase superfamily protein
MTFSIVAYDPLESAWGVAVASKFLAVGAVVPWARSGAGAVATQSYANTSFGPHGLDLMESGLTAQAALDRMIADDPQADQRQVGMVDQHGSAATYTGQGCYGWAGGAIGKFYAIQGNILARPQVIQEMINAYIAHEAKPFFRRLQVALLAGDRAGGDRRGRQSAAILIVKHKAGYSGFNDRWVDYRVDDHTDPVVRLGELLDLHELYFNKSPEEQKLQLAGDTLVQLQVIMKKLGYYSGEADSIYDNKTRTALEVFIGNENFEDRTDLSSGKIDAPVYNYLIGRHGA